MRPRREAFPWALRGDPGSGDTDRVGASVNVGKAEGPSLIIKASSGGIGVKLVLSDDE